MLNWLNGNQGKKIRMVVNYGNNTVRAWAGTLVDFDEYGLVLEDDQQIARAFPWYTCTEISFIS